MIQEDEDIIKCTAKDAYMWFVRPIMTPHETENGTYFTSWNKKKIALNDKNELILIDEGAPALFEIEVISSYPFGIDEYDDKCPAVVYSTHAGPELGRAVANVMLGKANPSGRLASTWYKKAYEFPSIFDYDIEKNKMTYLFMDEEPLYPFGYGLSYSKFEYSDFVVCGEDSEKITFSVQVTNVSETDGAEVVQIYFDKADSVYKRANKRMVAFARVNVPAGESKAVILTAPKHMLECYSEEEQAFVLERGEYTFHVGPDSSKYYADLVHNI